MWATHLVADLLYGLITAVEGHTAQQIWKQRINHLVQQVLKRLWRDSGTTRPRRRSYALLVLGSSPPPHHHILKRHPEVKLVRYAQV
jgi:hypothetical protein